MKTIKFTTTYKKILADVYTPVGIYLRLRDKFRDTILLESTDFHAGENSSSIIGINAIAGIEITTARAIESKLPGEAPQRTALQNTTQLTQLMGEFMKVFESEGEVPSPVDVARGLFGYSNYDAVQFFDSIELSSTKEKANELRIPLMRYRLYQYVIVINHFKDEMYICENHFAGLESRIDDVDSIIRSKDVPVFPFQMAGAETSNISDEAYRAMVAKGIAACHRGDVFQIVLSRRFLQPFSGDDFNVYRALRTVSPSPYLFYFDYGDYKLIGSSPESQLIISKGTAIVHPIAGTFKRTGDDETDKNLALELEMDKKETAEHVMLVDLARNDLSRLCSDVKVTSFKQVKFYSHVIHLVSEVRGKIGSEKNAFAIMGSTFPAGTLSGAPKYKAMELIDEHETTARGFYGGAIGFMGFDGSCNHAIMIRTFLSKNNTLIYQAGAGVVAASNPESELQEVNNKLDALKKAVVLAENI